MTLSDFKLGQDFLSAGGFTYRCTDIGQRTITAIPVSPGSRLWSEGPPYPVREVVFDELAMASCALNESDAIRAAVAETNLGIFPGYPHEAIKIFMQARLSPDYQAYPNKPLLRLMKVLGGDIYRAYGVRRDGEFWIIQCFCLFDEEYLEISERLFLECPVAVDADFAAKRACL